MQPVRQTTLLIASTGVLLLTLLLTQQFGDYRLSLSGLLIVIMLSAFARGWLPTLLAGIGSMIAMTIMLILWREPAQSIGQIFLSEFYLLLILALTMGSILYFKHVQENIGHGKTHLTSLFENATEGILLTNRIGKIILVNPSAERIFGYRAEELIGLSVDHLIPKRFQHHQLREQFHQQPSNRRMGTGRDLFATRKDGSEFPVEVSLSHYKQKEESFVIAFIVDITQRKKAEEELKLVNELIRRLNVELENKVEERTKGLTDALAQIESSQTELQRLFDRERELGEIKSRFVSMASHEFRTPLSTILSSATLISKYTKEDQQNMRDRHLTRICESVEHLNRLLEDFLSIGKLEEGRSSLSVSDFHIGDFITELVEEMNLHLLPGQSISVQVDGQIMITSDKRILKNALLNLLSNAVKFSKEGQAIYLISADSPTGKTFQVKDTGIGIPTADLPHIFSTFFRASNVTEIQGTGLGLSLVKRYADLIGGTVTLETEYGKGTSVTLDIPNMNVSS
jgi:PAS domain S-box-containing protein